MITLDKNRNNIFKTLDNCIDKGYRIESTRHIFWDSKKNHYVATNGKIVAIYKPKPTKAYFLTGDIKELPPCPFEKDTYFDYSKDKLEESDYTGDYVKYWRLIPPTFEEHDSVTIQITRNDKYKAMDLLARVIYHTGMLFDPRYIDALKPIINDDKCFTIYWKPDIKTCYLETMDNNGSYLFVLAAKHVQEASK